VKIGWKKAIRGGNELRFAAVSARLLHAAVTPVQQHLSRPPDDAAVILSKRRGLYYKYVGKRKKCTNILFIFSPTSFLRVYTTDVCIIIQDN